LTYNPPIKKVQSASCQEIIAKSFDQFIFLCVAGKMPTFFINFIENSSQSDLAGIKLTLPIHVFCAPWFQIVFK